MSGKAVLRAYRAQARVTVAEPGPVLPRAVPRVAGRRVMTIRAALEWAFGVECATLDFDDAGSWVVGADCVWRLMQRKALGCAVDGGGRSRSHPDADVIAACVADLPVAFGGRSMAVRIAELARAGRVPDPMEGAVQRCVPKGWKANNTGVWARTEVLEVVVTVQRGRKVRREVTWCPVEWTPTAAQIASARREHLLWRGALLDIACRLPAYGGLEAIEVTAVLPPAPGPVTRPRMGLSVPPATGWTTRA